MPSRFPRALGWLLLLPLGLLLGTVLGLSGRGSSLGAGTPVVIAVTMFGATAVFLLVLRWRADAHYDRLRAAQPDALILEAQKTDETVAQLSCLRGERPFRIGQFFFLVVDADGVAVHSGRRASAVPILLAWDRIGSIGTGSVRIANRSGLALVIEIDPPAGALPVAVRDAGLLSGVRLSPSRTDAEALVDGIEAIRRRRRAVPRPLQDRPRESGAGARRVLPGPSAAARRALGARLQIPGALLIAALLLLLATGVARAPATPPALPIALLVSGILLVGTGRLIQQLVPLRVIREYEAGYTTIVDGSTAVDHIDARTGAVLRRAGAPALTREQEREARLRLKNPSHIG